MTLIIYYGAFSPENLINIFQLLIIFIKLANNIHISLFMRANVRGGRGSMITITTQYTCCQDLLTILVVMNNTQECLVTTYNDKYF